MNRVPGGFTAPQGFLASGLSVGIKKIRKPDFALFCSDRPCTSAGVFTTNRIQAAPILVTREALRRPKVRAVVANSGNANACTGLGGLSDARRLARRVAETLDIPRHEVAVASTGVIGLPLPIDAMLDAIPRLVSRLSRRGGPAAARAIMTTDRFPKEVAVSARLGGRTITVGGAAKGSGMIHPNMATMLAFLSTDAAVSAGTLRRLLTASVSRTFNRITVDGDRSTNDMVLILANSLAKNRTVTGGRDAALLGRMIEAVCKELAFQIVRDAEGATKFVEISVEGAKSASQAETAAFAIARSSLVKTALYGQDPNWGRVMAAIGNAGIPIREDRIAIDIGNVPVVRRGCGLGPGPEERARRQMRKSSILLRVNLALGMGKASVWTSDLSTDYVKINAAYRT